MPSSLLSALPGWEAAFFLLNAPFQDDRREHAQACFILNVLFLDLASGGSATQFQNRSRLILKDGKLDEKQHPRYEALLKRHFEKAPTGGGR